MTAPLYYHLGFGLSDLGADRPRLAFLSGDPSRAAVIARQYLTDPRIVSDNRGLNCYLGRLPKGGMLLSATCGMGAPSLSSVVNELYLLGIRTILRVGTCGSIQPHVVPGSIVISSGAFCRQGAA